MVINNPTPPAFPTIAINDDTHRVTLRWSVHDGIHQYENDKGKLTEAIQHLLRNLFTDNDGLIYHWQDEDLNTSARLSRLHTSEL